MKTKEAQLKSFLVKHLNLNSSRIYRRDTETPVHLRFMTGCGVDSFQTLKQKLTQLNLPFSSAEYKKFSRTPDYGDQGLYVEFGDHLIGVQFNVQKEGRIRRKGLTPDSLGLAGKTFTDPEDLLDSATARISSNPFSNVLYSMIKSVATGEAVVGLETIQAQDLCRIISDFGEILAAYHSLLAGNTIHFPNNSNQPIADYYENERPVSVKGRNTGGKVNLSHWKSFISQETTAGKFLYSIAAHNKDDFFKYAAALCLEINTIAEMAGGTTTADVVNFVAATKYNVFYDYIKGNSAHNGLGIPASGRPQELWDQGSTEPFYFTINTIMSRLWGASNTTTISSIVRGFLQKPKFITLDVINARVIMKETEFSNITHWKTVYWGRATKAWHNWMAVEPINGLKIK
jgi:hypothetical protein